ncbi:MAG: FAD-dependent oxidoreductase [Deltaproteobacteria bacterium]|nr:MAG: FAD-dependent oxidoreductase [Deltaproteobacteria bacterium]
MKTNKLPTHSSVVVIGGGIMGCSALYHLAKENVTDAVLLERNELTSGTTWHSAAQVRALRSTQNLTDLIRYSVDLYSKLEEETGQMTGWMNTGSLSIATNKDRLIHIKRQEALAHLFGVQAQTISAGEAKERWPLMNTDDVIGAVWSPDDGRVGPSDICAALAKGAKARGAKIFENTGVTGILTKNQKVVGVETAKGTIHCDAIVLATGLWSRKAGAMGGVSVPAWPCEHFYLLTKPVPEIKGALPTLSDHDSHLYIRDETGGFLVGCFEPHARAIDPDKLGEDFSFGLLKEDWDHFEPMSLNALHRVPLLETVEVKQLLNGPEAFTPDGTFMLGESAETKGFYLCCGLNSIGIAIGGGAGMALAHDIVHGYPPMDLSELSPKRYPGYFNSAKALAERVPEILGTHYEITYPGRQHKTARNLRLMPLHEEWKSHNARFGQYYGWERPVYFNCLTEPKLTFSRPEWFEQVGLEVGYAHKEAALFDQSPFGKIEVEGPEAESFLNRICTNNMARPAGCAVYTAMLNERGTYESDLTVLRLTDEHYRLLVGTAHIKQDLAWLKRQKKEKERVSFRDATQDFAMMALMGPDSARIAKKINASQWNDLGYFRTMSTTVNGIEIQATRISYVGEAGWELMCPREDAKSLYTMLAQANAKPAGLYAQTSMRVEKKYLAYGHDLNMDMSPLEAGLEFAVHWQSDFIGRDALQRRKEKGIDSSLVLIDFNDLDTVSLGNEPVIINGEMIGRTTSAAFGYRIGSPVAIAFVKHGGAWQPEGQQVEINIAGDIFGGVIRTKPAFDPDGLVMRPVSNT